MKIVSLNASIYDLVKKYPEIVSILFTIGFKDITKPMMLNTAGRIMTLTKGSRMRDIDIEVIKEALRDAGFTIKEDDNNE